MVLVFRDVCQLMIVVVMINENEKCNRYIFFYALNFIVQRHDCTMLSSFLFFSLFLNF